MKKTFYIKTAFLSLMGMALLSSCLKDSRYVNFAGSKPLIELPAAANVGGGGGTFEVEAFAIKSTPQTFKIAVNIAAPNPLSSPLTVKLGLDTAAITAYNTANGLSAADGDAYTLLPSADYSSNLTVTIPAGQNLGYVTVSVNSSLIDPTQLYILPIKIVNGGGQQISNYDEILYNVQAKNSFDGVYTVTGTMNDTENPTLTGYYPATVQLQTTGANSNIYYDVSQPTSGGNGHLILASGALNEYGDFDPVFTFNTTNQTVTSVTNAYGQPAADGRSAVLDPTGVNAYTGTPGTSGFVIKVSYILVQAGVNRTYFNEVFTYTGSR